MSSISSSNYYSVSASTNNGFSGMISGMDTESMVEEMLSGTQGKIDEQEGLKQQALWKQEMYREIIDTINGFSDSFFDSSFGASSTNNFASSDFFNTMMSTVTSGSAVKIVATEAGASASDMSVIVKQLADNASITSDVRVSGGEALSGEAFDVDALIEAYDRQVSLNVDGTAINVNLNNATTQDEVVDTLNDALKDTGFTAKIFEGRMRIVSEDPGATITVDTTNSTAAGLQAAGLRSVSTSTLTDAEGAETGKMMQGVAPDTSAALTFDLTLDGVTKSITLRDLADDTGAITTDSVFASVQEQVANAFGDYVTVSQTAEGGIAMALNFGGEAGHRLTVTGVGAEALGLEPGDSTHLSLGSKLSDIGAPGDRYSFTINGEEFTFDGEDSISTLINTINRSDAGVRISYSTLSDTFSMETTSTGAKFGIDLSQQEGDLLGHIFGSDKISASSTVASTQLTTSAIEGGVLDAEYETEEAVLRMTVNGESYTFSLPKEEDVTYTAEDVQTKFNEWLSETFGTVEGTENANLSYSGGKLHIADGFTVSIAQSGVDLEDAEAVADAQKSDLALALGLNGKDNHVSDDTPLSEIGQLIGLDMRKADGSAATTLQDIASVNGHAVTVQDGRLVLSGSGTVTFGAGDEALAELFGASTITLGDGTAAADAVEAGQDALITVNGIDTSRSSNIFSLDGVSMELTEVSKQIENADGTFSYEETTIGTTRDVDSIVEGFASFVEEYNKMLDLLNGYVDEDSNYRDYAPLTDAQKKEMSENEIELWEEKAKEGLLRRDDTIDGFLREMRTAMYTKPDGNALALYDIGIETGDYKQNGKLIFDEAALRSALATDPQAVEQLFTDASEGLATKFQDIMDRTASTSSGSPGLLVIEAGIEGAATENNNTLYFEIQRIEDRIETLMDRYEVEKGRYWDQFNAMETILADYSAQSSYIAQQFGMTY